MNSVLSKHVLPDITSETSSAKRPTLQWVGMTRLPLQFELIDSHIGQQHCQGYGEIGVDLVDTSARGIHMSRLYLGVETFCRQQPLTPNNLQKLLRNLLSTHKHLSESISFSLEFELMVSRPALESDLQGYKAYPLRLHSWQNQETTGLAIEFTIPYSSTCPCSTSLAKAHLKEALSQQFSGEQLSKTALLDWIDHATQDFPTPHSQRSYARIHLQLIDPDAPAFDFLTTINAIEDSLQTAVQTAVKREDELAFAMRNGSNLMFCEDAARRLKHLLMSIPTVGDFWLEVDHQESLHAHNAVARASNSNLKYSPLNQLSLKQT